MVSEGGNNTARQRALLAVQERQKEIEIEDTERLKQIKETNREKWHNNRKKTPLSGSIRQREDSSVERSGGPAKLQAGGSPSRGVGVTKLPSSISSILRGKSTCNTSARKEKDRGKPSSNTPARKEKDRSNKANIASSQASRFSQGTKGGNGSGKGARKNKIAQESSNSTPRRASRGVTPTALFSQGLQPKSPKKRAQKANNNSTGDNDNTIDADAVPAEGESPQSATRQSASKVGWKAVIESSEDDETTITRNPWKESGFVDFTMELPANLKTGAQASDRFKDKIGSMLSVLQKIDDASCILHPKEPTASNVSARKELDCMHYIWGGFFRIDNDSAFKLGTNEKARLLRGTMMLGMAKDCKETIKMLSTDISIISGVNLYWKDLQALDTRKKIELPCAPIKIPAKHM